MGVRALTLLSEMGVASFGWMVKRRSDSNLDIIALKELVEHTT